MRRASPGKFTQRLHSVLPASSRGFLVERPLHQYPLRGADPRLHIFLAEAVDARLQHLQPPHFLLMRHVILKRGRRRAGTAAVDEAESLIESNLIDEPQGGLEILLGLTGEAHDEVRG